MRFLTSIELSNFLCDTKIIKKNKQPPDKRLAIALRFLGSAERVCEAISEHTPKAVPAN